MEILEIKQVNDALAEMVALFRVELRSYKGIVSKPNIEAGREEMEEYLSAKFPVYAALVDGEYAGYVVCRVVLFGSMCGIDCSETVTMIMSAPLSNGF